MTQPQMWGCWGCYPHGGEGGGGQVGRGVTLRFFLLPLHPPLGLGQTLG